MEARLPVLVQYNGPDSNGWRPARDDVVTGPISEDPVRSDYYILAPPYGTPVALPKAQVDQYVSPDDLTFGARNFRATISSTEGLTAFMAANRFPSDQAMIEGEKGLEQWSPAALRTVTGSINVNPPEFADPKSHFLLTPISSTESRFMLPAVQAKKHVPEADLAAEGRIFRATISSKGELSGLVPANHLPPGQVMIEDEPGSNDWSPIRWARTFIGSLKVDSNLENPQAHFVITPHSYNDGNRAALPAEQVELFFPREALAADRRIFRATISAEGELSALVPAEAHEQSPVRTDELLHMTFGLPPAPPEMYKLVEGRQVNIPSPFNDTNSGILNIIEHRGSITQKAGDEHFVYRGELAKRIKDKLSEEDREHCSNGRTRFDLTFQNGDIQSIRRASSQSPQNPEPRQHAQAAGGNPIDQDAQPESSRREGLRARFPRLNLLKKFRPDRGSPGR